MGKRDRERVQRIKEGKERPISEQKENKGKIFGMFRNFFSHNKPDDKEQYKRGVKKLQESSTGNQLAYLDKAANIDPGAVKKALMKNAPGEMDKAIRKFQAEGREITVDSLCEEINHTPAFVALCRKIGLEMSWFEDLARARMKAHRII